MFQSKETSLVFIGPATSGKTGQSEILAQKSGSKLVRGRDILPDHRTQYEGNRLLIPDQDYLPALGDYLSSPQFDGIGVVFDNVPRTEAQARLVLDWSSNPRRDLLVVSLDLTQGEVLERYQARLMCPSCETTYHPQLKPTILSGICDRDNVPLIAKPGDNSTAISESYQRYLNMKNSVLPTLEAGGAEVYHISARGTVLEVSRLIDDLLPVGQVQT